MGGGPAPRRRLPAVDAEPEGLVYRPGFLTAEEEEDLLDRLGGLEFEEVRMHGQPARRTVVHFGFRYGYGSWELTPAEPLPASFLWLRDRAAALVGLDADRFVEALVSRYPPGAGIGWHRDAPVFGPEVVGVSLLSPCPLRFQRRTATVRATHVVELAPRSAYALTGAARWVWQHSIRATAELRYSVTFRTVPSAAAPDGAVRRGTVKRPVTGRLIEG